VLVAGFQPPATVPRAAELPPAGVASQSVLIPFKPMPPLAMTLLSPPRLSQTAKPPPGFSGRKAGFVIFSFKPRSHKVIGLQ